MDWVQSATNLGQAARIGERQIWKHTAFRVGVFVNKQDEAPVRFKFQ